MFQLTKEEWSSLKYQIGISNTRGCDCRSLHYVFTEQGVSQLSGVLHNELANILLDGIATYRTKDKPAGKPLDI